MLVPPVANPATHARPPTRGHRHAEMAAPWMRKMSARLVVMESVVEAPTFCYRCDRERDRNTIEGLYEPWLKTREGIVCPSCLLPSERTFVDAHINGRVGALLAEEARRQEWQLDEP